MQGRRAALAALLHEYPIDFAVAIDRQGGRLPAKMSAFQMLGTPRLLVIDAAGALHAQFFRSLSDLAIGEVLGRLLRGSERVSDL